MAKSTREDAAKKSTGKRELIALNNDKRFIKKDEKGQISESDDQGKSLSQDVKKSAKTKVKSGYGDRGDQAPKRSTTKKATGSKASKKK